MNWKHLTVKFWRALCRLAKQIKITIVTVAVTVPLVGSRMPTELEQVQAHGRLTVISRNGPTTFYENGNGFTGYEYALAKAFADHLGVELEIVQEENLGRLLDLVGQKAEFAAAGLTVTPKRQRRVAFTRPYMNVSQQLIYNADEPKPESVDDLIGKSVLIISNSSHAEHLRELQKIYPDLKWQERNDLEMIDLQEMVHRKKVDYAIIDSNSFALNAALYPKAKVAFDVTEPLPLAWAFPISNDTSLLDAANTFLAEFEQSGGLAMLRHTFYGHLPEAVPEIAESNAQEFTALMGSRLPKWQPLIQSAAEEAQVDWRLIAALAYQESQWNPLAESATGVRGFMMLTMTTAKEMSISNRESAAQSIKGGTQYFKKLLDRIPEEVTGQDRFWFALTAYNIGYGHLEDAIELAAKHGANTNQWSSIKDYLPLLSKRQHYKTAKHGYVPGYDAVAYVQNIRSFYSILTRSDLEQERQTEIAVTSNTSQQTDRSQTESEFNTIISQVIARQQFAKNSL